MAQEDFLIQGLTDISAQWEHYFALLDPQDGDRVLDVGTNKGEALRLLAAQRRSLRLVGLDPRAEQLAVGANRAEPESSISFVAGDAHALPFTDASFDRAVCAETVEYLHDPVRALGEIGRVVKPGGVVLVTHTAWDTQQFSATDEARSSAVVDAFVATGPAGPIWYQIEMLLRDAGFSRVEPSVYAFRSSEWRPDRYPQGVATLVAEWVVAKGIIDEQSVALWLKGLEEQAANGTFSYAVHRLVWCCST